MINSPSQIRYWLALTSLPKIGIHSLLKTASQCAVELDGLIDISAQHLASIGWNTEQIACLKEPHPFTQKCLAWLQQSESRGIISYCCPEYPTQLKQISQAPILLFTEGHHHLLKKPQLAVVGSRSPSHSGLANTHQLLSEILCKSQLLITSGLALGIDAQSHHAALNINTNHLSGNSVRRTIGVLGNGIDIIYPKRHAKLYAQIRQHGLLVSEFPPGVMPRPKLFPRRNRIISGLSLGTLVCEARIKSGSLVTAKYALEQGREVFAMPSNINNQQAQGCHWLIKQGAKLTECAQDIFDELPQIHLKTAQKQQPEKKPKQNLATTTLLDSVGLESSQNDHSSSLLHAVDFDVTPIDLIAMRTGLSVSTLVVQLLEYELRGFVSSTSGGYLKLRD